MEQAIVTILTVSVPAGIAAVWWYFRSQHKEQIDGIEKAHETALADLKSSHSEAVSDLKSSHDQALQSLTAAHTRELEQVKGFQEERIALLRDQISEKDEQIRLALDKLDKRDTLLSDNTEQLAKVSELLVVQAQVQNLQARDRRMRGDSSEPSPSRGE